MMKTNDVRADSRAALAALTAAMLVLAGCASQTPRPSGAQAARGDGAAGAGAPRRGGYYLDDGPGSGAPDVDAIPDAVPRAEPLLARANRPYVVFERQYTPMTALAPYTERGVGTWYGRKYHGQRTSSGEVYDMYAMTAAHPTLPIPSYARVTHVRSGRSVVVRVNDRGPFLYGRIVDLSYTAAAKLGYASAGSAEVEVELITRFDRAATEASAAAAATSADAVVAGAAAASAPRADTASAPVAPAERLAVETVVAGAPGADRPNAAAAADRPSAVPTTGAMPTPGAAPTPAPTSAPAATPVTGSGARFLQLAAFTSRENAEASRARLAREFDWLADSLQVRQDGALFKVHAGPYRGREEALAAADRIRQATAFRPFPVAR